jgi:DNA-directed RNA polymerase specialized sigma24 family protein
MVDEHANQGTLISSLDEWAAEIFGSGKSERVLRIIEHKLAGNCQNPPECAKEILHDVLINLKDIDIKSIQNPPAYVITAASRLAVKSHQQSWFRKRTWMPEDVVELLMYVLDGSGPQVEQQRVLARIILNEFKRTLSCDEWKLFELYYYQGFTDKEISLVSHTYFERTLSRGAIRQRILRVTEKLRLLVDARKGDLFRDENIAIPCVTAVS